MKFVFGMELIGTAYLWILTLHTFQKPNRFQLAPGAVDLRIPLAMDPSFGIRPATNIARMIQKWGTVPAAFLKQFAESPHTYAFVGTEDVTMYPLVLPGSFLQIDESRTEILSERWRSEYERPIYFIETTDGFLCSWCSLKDRSQLIIQPHPLSPAAPRLFKYRQDAKIIGQVVAVAMRLDQWSPELKEEPKPISHLN